MRKVLEICKCPQWFITKITTPSYEEVKIAIWKQEIDKLRQLLQQGGPLYEKNQTILHFAVSNNKLQAVEFLCENCYELVEQRNENGDTPFLLSLFLGDLKIISLLLSVSKLNVRDNFGNSAFMIAAANNNLQILEKLIAYVNPAVKNHEGQSALHRACYYGHIQIVRFLIENTKLKFYQIDHYSNNSLHLACQGCSIICIKYIINKVQNPSMLLSEQNKEGKTPLQQLQSAINQLNASSTRREHIHFKQIYEYLFNNQYDHAQIPLIISCTIINNNFHEVSQRQQNLCYQLRNKIVYRVYEKFRGCLISSFCLDYGRISKLASSLLMILIFRYCLLLTRCTSPILSLWGYAYLHDPKCDIGRQHLL